MNEATRRFVSEVCSPLLRVIATMEGNGISPVNIAPSSPCGREKAVSEQRLQPPMSYITIPGVVDYIMRSVGIAGTHIHTGGRLLLLDWKYFPSSSVMALARISMEASANALWLCSNEIPWDERLRRFAGLYLDRMKASRADLSYLEQGDDAEADDVIATVEDELARQKWQPVEVPRYVQRVRDASANLEVDGSGVYGLTSKAIHADPTVESFDISSEWQLRDRAMSAVYISHAVLLWVQAHTYAASWQDLPRLDVAADLELFSNAVDGWLNAPETGIQP